MSPEQIDRFFETLARELDQPARIIVTGAAAASIWGSVRPSLDVDFAIELTPGSRTPWETITAAVERTTRLTGIQANYAEDIDRWGSITLLDYRRHTRPYRTFAKLDVRLLDPLYWSIGKISRYLDPDEKDLVVVFRKQKIPARRVLRLWKQALRASPRSTALASFRRHAEAFCHRYGRAIWGPQFDPDQALRDLIQ